VQDISLVLTSTMPEDRKEKALEAAQEFIRYLAVLGVGALGFALTGLSPTPRDSTLSLTLLVGSAALLAVSVFMGILAHGTLISQLYHGEIDLEDRYLSWQTRGQWVLFLAGIVALGIAIFVRDVVGRYHNLPVHVSTIPY
jgi:hypothetical protein